jgi:hypothetical protein
MLHAPADPLAMPGGYQGGATMVSVGNHLKVVVPTAMRPRIREFYDGLLGLRPIPSPRPDLDLYEFHGGFVLGFFFTDSPAEVLSLEDYAKATWLELKVQDPAEWKTRLLAFGVREIAFPDPGRFFFQAPDGQVFRLAPIDGGL